MPVDAKIRLCSNLLREPHVFEERLGNLAGGIARDLVLYAAWSDQDYTVIHLPQFCEMMGYNNKHLLRKLTEEQANEIKAANWGEKGTKALSNTVGFAIHRMASFNLIFADKEEHKPKTGEYSKKTLFFDSLQLVTRVGLKVKSTGTIIQFKLDEQIIIHNRGRHYQTVYLADYLSLKTPKGRADDQARRMYLRLVWKRQYWDSKPTEAGVRLSQDDYQELLKVACIDCTDKKESARRLKALLKRVAALPSVRMRPKLGLNYLTGFYEVSWTRDPLPTTSNPHAKPRAKRKTGTAKLAESAEYGQERV